MLMTTNPTTHSPTRTSRRWLMCLALPGLLLVGGVCALRCGGQPPEGSTAARSLALRGLDSENGPAQIKEPSAEPFHDGKEAFQMVRQALLKKYYRGNLTEDDLYRAAVQGMLENVDPGMRSWNKLLPPEEIAELHRDLSGELVGVGVEIRFEQESGISDVLGLVPGSPAEKAGLLEGDKILDVNGKFYKGLTLRDVVADIRGKAGETVRLTVLRGDKLVTFDVRREHLTYESVIHAVLPGLVGYLGIRLFNEGTAAALRTALSDIERQRVKALVVDLRHNEGGLFDKAVESAGLFLKKDTPIVRVQHRSGPEEVLTAQGEPVLGEVPVCLLVNHSTSSGAELFTGALREGRKAQVIGQKTFGKWSAQTLEDLPNGYAMKYTTSLFRTPGGKSYEGVGLVPDVEVPMDDKEVERAQRLSSVERRLAADPQLRTAVNIVLLQASR